MVSDPGKMSALLFSCNELFEVMAPHPLGLEAADLAPWGKLSPVTVHFLDNETQEGLIGSYLPGGILLDYLVKKDGDEAHMRAFIPYGQIKRIIGPAEVKAD